MKTRNLLSKLRLSSFKLASMTEKWFKTIKKNKYAKFAIQIKSKTRLTCSPIPKL